VVGFAAHADHFEMSGGLYAKILKKRFLPVRLKYQVVSLRRNFASWSVIISDSTFSAVKKWI
jgi:hypothetical protein